MGNLFHGALFLRPYKTVAFGLDLTLFQFNQHIGENFVKCLWIGSSLSYIFMISPYKYV